MCGVEEKCLDNKANRPVAALYRNGVFVVAMETRLMTRPMGCMDGYYVALYTPTGG